MPRRAIFGIIFIAFLAAVAGVFVGRQFLPTQSEPRSDLHAVLHEQLHLNSRQEAQIDQLEHQFGIRRTVIELELRADNARLAEAIEAEHGYGPRVSAAVDRSHAAMGDLQKQTLAHIFAMRQILRPDQAAKFDRAVAKALTADSP